MQPENSSVCNRLDVLITKLKSRKERYSSSRKKLWIIFLIPIILSIIIFISSINDLSHVGTIIGALIAFVGTILAYVDVYYRREIDITINKIEAVED